METGRQFDLVGRKYYTQCQLLQDDISADKVLASVVNHQ